MQILSVSNIILLRVKQMFGNGVEINLFYRQILGPLVLGWAPYHFLLGAQLAPGKKRSACIPGHVKPLYSGNP